MSDSILKVLRIPEGDIVVTRKVPMTDQTCDELRAIKQVREETTSAIHGEEVMIPIPTIIKQLINEEYQRLHS